MCNDYGNRIAYRDYVEVFSHMRLPLLFPEPQSAPNLEPRDEIWPSDTAPVIHAVEGGTALVQPFWGLAPARPGARLVINLRTEGRSFRQGRCLVPASHYYEFTGNRSPKQRWRFSRTDGHWLCFAGLLGRGPGGVDAFALLTADAGPDAAAIHGRQPVVLERAAWAAWLAGEASDGLLGPSPAGTLGVASAPRDGAELFAETTQQQSLLK